MLKDDVAASIPAARNAVTALLDSRARDATICPSEVARNLVAAADRESWRDAMPAVHAAVDAMVREGQILLSWKGAPLAARAGPYRIGRGPRV